MKATRKEIQDANTLIELMWPNLSVDLQYRFRHAIGTIGCAINEIHEIPEEKKTPEDIIVTKVAMKYFDRSEVGIKKYGTTLENNSLPLMEWLNHLQEELMDATLYIEKLKQEI